MSNEYKDWTIENYKEEIARLTQQRDELLALLVRWRKDFDAYPADPSLEADTDAAITKVKEQK